MNACALQLLVAYVADIVVCAINTLRRLFNATRRQSVSRQHFAQTENLARNTCVEAGREFSMQMRIAGFKAERTGVRRILDSFYNYK